MKIIHEPGRCADDEIGHNYAVSDKIAVGCADRFMKDPG
jgi:hypothetical protein